MINTLRGIGVALVTPLTSAGEIDYMAFEKLINHTIEGGVHFLVVQGTTGESATLTSTQKQALLTKAVAIIDGRVPVVYGHGGNNTAALISSYSTLDLTGVSAILSVSPYYNKPTQEGIIAHFTALNDAFDLPIILYNVPGRTGSNMTPKTTLELSKLSNIIGVKEASGDLDQMTQIIKHRPKGFLVLSGDDDLLLQQMAMGADGGISVVANAFPKAFSTLFNAAESNDYTLARDMHYALCDVIPLLFAEGNPGGIKAVLKMIGIGEEHMLLPLLPISEELRLKLHTAANTAGLL